MTTTLGTRIREPVAVPELHQGDLIHVSPHKVFRRSGAPHTVKAADADVEVDSLLDVKGLIVIIVWHIPGCGANCVAVTGATVYDADDCVLREVAA